MIGGLRAFFYYAVVGPLTAVFGLLGLVILPLPRRWRYFVITRWSVFAFFWLKVTCGLGWRVHGRENVPAGPCVILCKHQSAWETMALQMVFPPQSQVAKKELLYLPFFGWGLASLNPIFIDRKAGSKAARYLLSAGKERLKDGWCVLIFPEGTRTVPGQRGKYSSSGAMLALQSGYPLVPVAHNAGVFWPRNAFLKHSGTIDLVVGPPIDPAGRSAADLTREAEAWIEARCAELPGPRGQVDATA